MASISPIHSQIAPRRRGVPAAGPRLETRFDRRLAKILVHATNVFYEKGYAAASMRDLSRASGVSLSGLYYYFESKEELLYLIQKDTFTTIVERLRERLQEVDDPAERIRSFIHNHLDYFLANQKAMKVLSHEDDVLKNGFGAEIAAIKREYYRICMELLDQLQAGARTGVFQPDRGAQPVWHDELDLYLVQPASRCQRRGTGAGDGRHFPSGHRSGIGQSTRRRRSLQYRTEHDIFALRKGVEYGDDSTAGKRRNVPNN